MFRSIRFALIIPLVFLTMLVNVPVASAVTDAPSNSSLSEEMLDTYCKMHGNRGVVLLPGRTAYDWKCETPDRKLIGINMDAVCSENNKRKPNIIAWMDEQIYHNALYAWSCVQYKHGGLRGHLDMNAACKKFGNQGAFLSGQGRHSVDDWMCRDGSFVSDIRLQVACDKVFDGTRVDYVVPRFNYWDPYSITCWR
jgi:hypothetical protein